MQEAVEQRGLGLVCPAISFDTTLVLVTEAGLSPLEFLRAILALEASAYHHNGQMSLVYLRNLLAIERLRIVDSRKHWAWPWEQVNVTPLKPGAMHLVVSCLGQRGRSRRSAKRPRIR
ncbi:g3144 [Coccomyxa viridis]|uniref:G3144 protein n=1 Tax=Coccomyxa viridis TaxID=1274662 RepID=A0ABP1FM41_9CHLO